MEGTNWTAAGSIATALAVLIAAWQLYRGGVRTRTNFEDDLSREYRALSGHIPVSVFLGKDLVGEAFEEAFPTLYQYIDLTNEQVFLRMNGRICKATWINWRDGIKSNLGLPAFNKAWALIKENTKSFEELRRLETGKFTTDPRRWLPVWKRLWHC